MSPRWISLALAAGCGATEGASGGQDAGTADRCERWNTDRAEIADGTWSGSVAACDPGDMDPAWREQVLRQINLYRWLAGQAEVTNEPGFAQRAQACSLMMHANQQLSHTPPASWECWSQAGADGAGSSNIANAPGVSAIDLFMVDPGNPTTIGHRRWILSPRIGRVGVGSTSEFSCLHVFDDTGTGDAAFVAWPPPGRFPIQAATGFDTSIDQTGWTVQSDDVDLDGATVTVTADGSDLPVALTLLKGGYGSAHAVSLVPQGWAIEAGVTYHVEFAGVSTPIAYDVEPVDCQDPQRGDAEP